MKTPNSLIVGVTGGIGSGKSEVCRIFQEFGAYVISADDLAKRLMETNKILRRQITKTFGRNAYTPNGTLNRSKLSAAVFSNPQKKDKLDSIVHPHVLTTLQQMIHEKRPIYQVIIIEAALIYESGAETLMDFVVVVDSDRETRIRRVMRRDGVSRVDVLRRSGAQMSQREKIQRADFIILNNHDLTSLKKKVAFLYKLFIVMTH